MGILLKSATLYSVMNEEMMNSDDGVKSEFQKWLNDNMRNGVVRPFDHIVVKSSEFDSSK